MGKRLLLLLICATSIHVSFAQIVRQYNYQIEPVVEGDQTYFNVTISFKSSANGMLNLMFPHVWGMDEKPDFIQQIQVSHAEYTEDSSSLSLKVKKNVPVRISYRLNNAVEDSIPGRGQEYLPTIKPTYFTLFSNSGLLVPEHAPENKYTFRIQWKNYPKEYRTLPITSFGNGLTQEIKTATSEDLQNAIFVGGDYRLYEQTNEQKQVTRFAIRGKWSFKDEEMGELVASTLKQQRLFWNDYSTKNYLITISAGGYTNEFEQSYTGTGLHNSFAVTGVCNSATQVSSLYYLFHHELMHHWIGHSIKNAADEELSYWFSEGFTDYFSRKNMFESGIISKKEYIQLLDSVLSIHYNNSLADHHNDSIKAHFWTQSYYSKLPYNRGSIFAYYLDGKIQTLSNGRYDLKAVMRNMLSQTHKKQKQFEWHWLQQEILTLINYDIAPDIHNYILKGELIPIDTLNAALHQDLELRSVKVFGNGFTTEKNPETGKTLITAIEENSGAGIGGLKIGDQVKGYSLYANTSMVSELYVVRDGKEVTLPFYAYVLSKPLPQHKE